MIKRFLHGNPYIQTSFSDSTNDFLSSVVIFFICLCRRFLSKKYFLQIKPTLLAALSMGTNTNWSLSSLRSFKHAGSFSTFLTGLNLIFFFSFFTFSCILLKRVIFHRRTDDVKSVYPPFQLRWSGGYNNERTLYRTDCMSCCYHYVMD